MRSPAKLACDHRGTEDGIQGRPLARNADAAVPEPFDRKVLRQELEKSYVAAIGRFRFSARQAVNTKAAQQAEHDAVQMDAENQDLYQQQ